MAMRQLWHSQNFIKNKSLIEELLKRTNICSSDLVLEIGPGTGVISEQLCKVAKHVIGVEKDQLLSRAVEYKLSNEQLSNYSIIRQDLINYSLPSVDYKVFANIPFNYTADIVRKLLCSKKSPTDAYLFMQKEAAERFMGMPKTTLFSLHIAPFYKTQIIHRFECTDFHPAPSVDVVLVHFKKRDPPIISLGLFCKYKNFISYCFRSKNAKQALLRIFSYKQMCRFQKEMNFKIKNGRCNIPFEVWLHLFRFVLDNPRHVSADTIENHITKKQQKKLYRTRKS